MGTSEPHHQGGPFFEPSPGRENDWWPGFEIEIDDIKFHISHRRIVERQSDDGPHYAQASLTVTEVKALLEARSFKLYYATPRYLGYRATSGKLSAKDRASLAVTLRNCVN